MRIQFLLRYSVCRMHKSHEAGRSIDVANSGDKPEWGLNVLVCCRVNKETYKYFVKYLSY